MGKYYTNGRILTCDGDLILNKPLYLKNLILDTKEGCRIYSTKSVFIEGQSSIETGIRYHNKTELSNLQIASSKFISLGLGRCSDPSSYGRQDKDLVSKYGTFARVKHGYLLPRDNPEKEVESYLQDVLSVVDANNEILMSNAGDCKGIGTPSRKVSFEHLLLSAPRIDSRYSGDYTGVIIAKFALWSLGKFSFKYDNIFENATVLPLLTTSIIDIEK